MPILIFVLYSIKLRKSYMKLKEIKCNLYWFNARNVLRSNQCGVHQGFKNSRKMLQDFEQITVLKMKMTIMIKSKINGVLLILLSFCFFFHISAAVDYPQQQSQRQHDKILRLPGQPDKPTFEQYGGYITVDEKAAGSSRALFYYFVKVADPSLKNSAPLFLWLNGGPGCSSLGEGALNEIGPYRVKSDGRTLYKNEYSWNQVANLLFLESPAGVGFSYSNTSGYMNNDESTAVDSFSFLLKWLEIFPEFKDRDFYIVGESYAGHYVPQLALKIFQNNKSGNHSNFINLKGIVLGNPLLEEEFRDGSYFEYLWTHAVISDEVIENIRFNCNFSMPYEARGKQCYDATNATLTEAANEVNIRYNIYAPQCHSNITTAIPKETSLTNFDPCSSVYVHHYLNLAKVQQALHARSTSWVLCRKRKEIYDTRDMLKSTLSLLPNVMANGVPILVYSGDFDSIISFMSTKNVLKKLNLTEVVQWSPWKSDDEVAGYHIVYQGGLTFTTIKGSGHMVPSDQAKRAFAMINNFLQGKSFI